MTILRLLRKVRGKWGLAPWRKAVLQRQKCCRHGACPLFPQPQADGPSQTGTGTVAGGHIGRRTVVEATEPVPFCDCRPRAVVLSLALAFAGGVLLVAIVCSTAFGQSPQHKSLDEELMRDLGGNPADEVDRESPGGDAKRPKNKAEAAPEENGQLEERLRRELGAAAQSGDENPLLSIARRMHEVEGRIGRKDSGLSTQAVQRGIVSDLERLIEQARKACQGGQAEPSSQPQASSRTSVGPPPPPPKGGGQKPSDKPAAASSERHDTSKAKPLDLAQTLDALQKKVWGALPEHEREQLLQLRSEEFLPKYQSLIEQYYRRLSEAEDTHTDYPERSR